jgi:ATP-binding cassette, subfamily B, bacterial CvaB/MchF/RaxB
MSDPVPVLLAQIFGRRRLPDLRQAEAAECGLVCLAMIAHHHGDRTDLAELRARFGFTLKGASLPMLMRVANDMQLTARPLRFEIEALDQLKLPCILHWDMNHFVVLWKVGRDAIEINDPALGPRTISRVLASNHVTGVALELTPTVNFKPVAPMRPPRLSDFWSRAPGLTRGLVAVVLAAVLIEVCVVLGPLAGQTIVDVALGQEPEVMRALVIGLLFLVLFECLFKATYDTASLYVSTSLSFQLESNLFRHLIRLPHHYFERRHVGDIMSRFGSIGAVQSFITQTAVSSGLGLLIAVTAVIILFVYSKMLALVTIGTLLLSFCVRLAMLTRLRGLTSDMIQSDAREQTILLETLRTQRGIKMFGREEEREAIWKKYAVDNLNASVKLQRANILAGTIETGLAGLEMALVLAIGLSLVGRGDFTLGMLFAYQAYARILSARTAGLIDAWYEWQMLRVHLGRLSDITFTPIEPGLLDPQRSSQLISGQLTLKDVHFRYGMNEPWVLDGVSIDISPGEIVAIVGPTGCGKSTLIKLMLGLVQPAEGEVQLDESRLAALGPRVHRRAMSAVLQDDALLSGSISDNICFFDRHPDLAWTEECTKLAHVYADIMRLPMGMATLVGDMGSVLSAGQKQRVLLARALYPRPSVLILDEGTANLDRVTEERVLDAVNALGITIVLVTHGDLPLTRADRIFRLEFGRLEQVLHPLRMEAL